MFDSIGVRINGDAARIFIPQTVKPGSRVPVVWLYHAAESSQDALLGGFRGIGEKAVDRGAIAICQNAGGTLYSHPTAQQHQRNGFAYLSSLYSVSGSYLRATSGGGALACETYGAQLIPGILGLYLVNGVYDLRKLYALGGRQMLSVGRAFGFSTGQIDRANPARHPTIAWTRTASRVAVSSPSSTDTSVPPRDHGLALAAKAGPVAIEASVRTHGLGHTTPAWADTDFLAAMDRWVPTTPSA